MNKTVIQAELPAELAARAKACVADGWASGLDDLSAGALRRFLEFQAAALTESFVMSDLEWGVRGRD